MLARAALLLVVVAVLAVGGAAPAFAALGDEVAAGGTIAKQLQARTTTCSKLSETDLEHLGEYVMERMVGSRAAHAAMNQRMASMMGAPAEERMHQLMGRRYAGCGGSSAAGAGAGGMMGGGGAMMGGVGGAAMMRSSDLGWMRDGSWRHMSRSQWRGVQSAWMGNGMMGGGHHGRGAGEVLAVIIGALLVGALAAFLAIRRPWKRRPPTTPAAA